VRRGEKEEKMRKYEDNLENETEKRNEATKSFWGNFHKKVEKYVVVCYLFTFKPE
jgi:hypothetical protein